MIRAPLSLLLLAGCPLIGQKAYSEKVDVDGDGADDVMWGGLDCDDGDPDIGPDEVDVPDNDVDEDCDGLVSCHEDRDGDGFFDEDVYDVGTAATIPQLYLPVNQVVEFQLNSPDVIHSFWVPSFYFKMDLIPGRTNSFQITPTREGTYAGRCSELCGTYHSRMLFEVVVVSEEEYRAHLDELEAKGQTGLVEVPLRATYDSERGAIVPGADVGLGPESAGSESGESE